MDPADVALHAIFGRNDFVGGIDNEALDFSQLEAFINSEGAQNAAYFGESLGGKLVGVVAESKRTPHSLPESPPDSSSEHPYSPAENGGDLQNNPETIYTTLASGQPTLINMGGNLGSNLILGSHIVISESNPEMLDNLHDPNRLISDDLRNHLTDRLIQPNFIDRRDDLLMKNNEEIMNLNYGTHMDIGSLTPSNIESTICDGMVYTNLQSAKKRKSEIKSEPGTPATLPKFADKLHDLTEHCSPSQNSPNAAASVDEEYAASESCLSDSQYQCIRFQAFQQTAWHVLCDQNLAELPSPHYRVDADKGFNFSNADDAFVCQKKNHFQVTCHVQLVGDAQFVKTSDGFQKISSFHLHFYGVKHDCPTQTIRVEQSQSDRSKKPFHPVPVELVNSQVTKVTVGRLHFSETTSNNMRKKGKPNPEQRYFQLVVGLHAHTTHGNYPIISHASQKIIVRASNPGQFESDVELCWQKGQNPDSVYHAGKVGINTDRPDESLVVHGNLKITGHIVQPSDLRAKKNITECSTAEQLRNVQKLRVVRYEYDPGFAAQLNRSGFTDTGVIAQEVATVIPEAVRPAGDLLLENGARIDNFLVVNKERIFMENIGAVKELCKVTDNLETRIDQLERLNKRLKMKSTKQKLPDAELCSNKFIQVVIIILVLIMALCLAAITTLYLLEAQRHNQLTQASLKAVQRSLTTVRPVKNKYRTWRPYLQMTTNSYKNLYIPDVNYEFPKLTRALGKPGDCLENEDLCQVYCCAKLDSAELFEPKTNNSNRTEEGLLNNVVPEKLFHSGNNIEKSEQQQRQRRDADDWTDRDNNNFDSIDELQFSITVQGKHFNATLNEAFLSSDSTPYNYTYIVPISKYMPDEFLTLVFQSSQAHLKDIEQCFNGFKQRGCPWGSLSQRKINENVPSQLINAHSVTFEVDLSNFQSKVMTYRASLKQNQNKCKLASTKLGIEFTEYNLHLFRQCDE